MTLAVVSILSSSDRLSPDEQQEIVLELLERMAGDNLTLESRGLSSYGSDWIVTLPPAIDSIRNS